MGDVHGDLNATRQALELAGLIDDEGHWTGGGSILVQTGDVFDRGDDEREIVQLLDRLESEAEAAGGMVVRLNGNHELMNVLGDMRYVTPGGFLDYSDQDTIPVSEDKLRSLVEDRIRAFAPGGPAAAELADQPVAIVIEGTLFVHGGLEPKWADQYEDINRDVAAWLRGDRPSPPEAIMAEDGPVWSRRFSDELPESDCPALTKALREVGAERMVVGHTVQKDGITSACNGKVWRIDTGMSAHYGGQPQLLRISDGEISVQR